MATKNKYIPLIIGVAIAAGVVIGGKLNFTDTSDNLFTTNSKKDKLNRLIDYIDYEYVDEVNTDSIVDVTVNGILDNLDPHSTYIPKEDLERITESMKGDFVGIGINYYPYKDTIAVIKPTEDGPSESAGIMSGDRILLADGDTIYGRAVTNDYISKKLKGEKNTRVKLTVYRKSEDEILEFEVKRKTIPIKSVDAAYMLTDDLGYIKMNRFAETSYREFKVALEDLQDQGATKLALDLRDNPGGFLGIAEQIADEFLEDDKLILFTRDKKGKEERLTKNVVDPWCYYERDMLLNLPKFKKVSKGLYLITISIRDIDPFETVTTLKPIKEEFNLKSNLERFLKLKEISLDGSVTLRNINYGV